MHPSTSEMQICPAVPAVQYAILVHACQGPLNNFTAEEDPVTGFIHSHARLRQDMAALRFQHLHARSFEDRQGRFMNAPHVSVGQRLVLPTLQARR